MPGVATIKDGKRLGNVKVEPVVRRKGPEAKVKTISRNRKANDQGAAQDGLPKENQDGRETQGRVAL